MSKRIVPDLKELFKQASEIAQQVPESMQEAAFNRAIDLLTGSTLAESESAHSPETQYRKKKRRASKQTETDGPSTSLDDLLAQIDSTQHPGVISDTKVLDRSLMILHIALQDHGYDGLTPTEIARVLTEKFRVGTTAAAVRMALGNATALVNRVKEGTGYKYRIMEPGVAHLAHLGEVGSVSPSRGKKKKRKSGGKSSGKKKKVIGAAAKKKTRTGTGRSSKEGSVGPKAAISALLDAGYFDEAHTGPEVQAYLKSKRGFGFGIDQLRLAMLRLVREGKLERDENEDGQYEYKRPKS